jgi:hypothetical protein
LYTLPRNDPRNITLSSTLTKYPAKFSKMKGSPGISVIDTVRSTAKSGEPLISERRKGGGTKKRPDLLVRPFR